AEVRERAVTPEAEVDPGYRIAVRNGRALSRDRSEQCCLLAGPLALTLRLALALALHLGLALTLRGALALAFRSALPLGLRRALALTLGGALSLGLRGALALTLGGALALSLRLALAFLFAFTLSLGKRIGRTDAEGGAEGGDGRDELERLAAAQSGLLGDRPFFFRHQGSFFAEVFDFATQT